MKCHPLRWIGGLVPIALFSFIAAYDIQDQVEGDLSKRATEALHAANFGWAHVRFDGRDGVLSGTAPEEDEPGKAIHLAYNTYGVRFLDGQAGLLRKADPYTWSASHRDGHLKLHGFVPNEIARKTVLAAAKSAFPKADIEDKLELARGNPPLTDWLEGVKFDLKELAGLKHGKAELNGLHTSIEGEALTVAAYKAVKTALSTGLPKVLRLGTDKVTPPVVSPYVWNAKLAANQVTLSGFVPSEHVHVEVLTHAKRAFGKSTVVDKLELGEGVPEDFDKAVRLSLDQLATLQEGSADIKGHDASLQGMALDEGIAEATRKAYRSGAPSSFKIAEAIKAPKAVEPPPPPPPAAQPAGDSAERAKRESELQESARREADIAAKARREADEAAAEARRLATLAAAEDAKRNALLEEARRAAAACESGMRAIANNGTVTFEIASDVISRQSKATLKAIAAVAQKCGAGQIEVSGHTDSEGIPERNQPLSERRAQSVADFLVDNGVDINRIRAVGYGDTRPIAPNETAEGRAKNQRIEFSVKNQ